MLPVPTIAAQNSDQSSFAVREFVAKGHIEKPKSTVLFSLLPASTAKYIAKMGAFCSALQLELRESILERHGPIRRDGEGRIMVDRWCWRLERELELGMASIARMVLTSAWFRRERQGCPR